MIILIVRSLRLRVCGGFVLMIKSAVGKAYPIYECKVGYV
jgi:hypothetical protein